MQISDISGFLVVLRAAFTQGLAVLFKYLFVLYRLRVHLFD